MADCSKLTILGNTYNIKDAEARKNIGTMTGLKTGSKDSLVNAVNDLYGDALQASYVAANEEIVFKAREA